jgi:hypothetical protein
MGIGGLLPIILAILLLILGPICCCGTILCFIFTRCLKRRPKADGTGERWVCRKAIRSCKCWISRPRSLKDYLQAKGANNIDVNNYQPQGRQQAYVDNNNQYQDQ